MMLETFVVDVEEKSKRIDIVSRQIATRKQRKSGRKETTSGSVCTALMISNLIISAMEASGIA